MARQFSDLEPLQFLEAVVLDLEFWAWELSADSCVV